MMRVHFAARSLRKILKMNQETFWGRIGVGQSGGSRYEAGRALPLPVYMLLQMAYLSPLGAVKVFAKM